MPKNSFHASRNSSLRPITIDCIVRSSWARCQALLGWTAEGGCPHVSIGTNKKPRLSRGLCRWFYRTLSVTSSIAQSQTLSSRFRLCQVTFGGQGTRTLVADRPLGCLTDSVQYPLATPSKQC